MTINADGGRRPGSGLGEVPRFIDLPAVIRAGGCLVCPPARADQAVDVYDCVRDPNESGYPAIHLVVLQNGRRIEIQLRTPWQDMWAQSTEEDTARLGLGLKFGLGPDDLCEYYPQSRDDGPQRRRSPARRAPRDRTRGQTDRPVRGVSAETPSGASSPRQLSQRALIPG